MLQIYKEYKDNSSNDVAMNARNNPYHGGCGFLTSEMAMYPYTVMARSEKASNYLFVIIKKALRENESSDVSMEEKCIFCVPL